MSFQSLPLHVSCATSFTYNLQEGTFEGMLSCRLLQEALLLLPNDLLLSLLQLSILPGDFSITAAACLLGSSSCHTVTSMTLRHLFDLGLVDKSVNYNNWRVQSSVRAAAAELAVHLQLPLISARYLELSTTFQAMFS